MDAIIWKYQLIVVFDSIRANNNLEGAIADAMLKRIYFLHEKDGSANYDSLVKELKWCLVRFSYSEVNVSCST